MLIGTSSGGLTSAFYASGQLEVLADLCLTIKNSELYSLAPWKAFTKEACLLDNTPLRNLLTKNLDCGAVRKFGKPVLVNVTNVSNWQSQEIDLVNLDDEAMIDALLATTSVPGAFPVHNNFVDGGVTENFPIIDALGQQCDRIILVVTATIDPTPINNLKDMIAQMVSVSLYNQLSMSQRMLELVYLKNPELKLTELITIQPNKPTNIPLLDIDGISLERRKAYMKEGTDLALKVLKNVSG